jgi:hypothetical protein
MRGVFDQTETALVAAGVGADRVKRLFWHAAARQPGPRTGQPKHRPV